MYVAWYYDHSHDLTCTLRLIQHDHYHVPLPSIPSSTLLMDLLMTRFRPAKRYWHTPEVTPNCYQVRLAHCLARFPLWQHGCGYRYGSSCLTRTHDKGTGLSVGLQSVDPHPFPLQVQVHDPHGFSHPVPIPIIISSMEYRRCVRLIAL